MKTWIIRVKNSVVGSIMPKASEPGLILWVPLVLPCIWANCDNLSEAVRILYARPEPFEID